MSSSVLKALPGKIDIERHPPIAFSISRQASRCQQAFSKPSLVHLNLVSKDTHLVFSISRQASRCQQAFSSPCLINLLSGDTRLVSSISRQASRCQQKFSFPCLVNLISKDTHLRQHVVYSSLLRICHKFRNLMCWPIYSPTG